MTKDDIANIAKVLDAASVPEYGRVAAITDENGTILVSGRQYADECWTVTKREDNYDS